MSWRGKPWHKLSDQDRIQRRYDLDQETGAVGVKRCELDGTPPETLASWPFVRSEYLSPNDRVDTGYYGVSVDLDGLGVVKSNNGLYRTLNGALTHSYGRDDIALQFVARFDLVDVKGNILKSDVDVYGDQS